MTRRAVWGCISMQFLAAALVGACGGSTATDISDAGSRWDGGASDDARGDAWQTSDASTCVTIALQT